MVAYLGMSKTLPNICFYNRNEYAFQRPYSESTAREIDQEVLKIVNEQYTRAKNILMEHKEGHNALAELLIKKEVIMAEPVSNFIGGTACFVTMLCTVWPELTKGERDKNK